MKKQKNNSFEEKFKDFLDNTDVTDLKGGTPDEILLKAMKPLLEKMLNAEMDEHLGYKKHENNEGQNSRNGYSEKNC